MEITSLAGGENPGGMADEHPPQDDYDGHAEDGDGGGLAVKQPTLSDSGLWTGQALARLPNPSRLGNLVMIQDYCSVGRDDDNSA